MSEAKITETSRLAASPVKGAWLNLVREQVASLRFGTVLITVHDSRVVQVEKLEKVRIDSSNS